VSIRARSILLAACAVMAACERRAAPAEAPVQAADDNAKIRKLFDDAEACGDRYECPPLAELQDRAERPGELRVLEVAFDIMCDPKVDTFERLFKMASATARAWAAARAAGGKRLSIDDERALRAHVMRLLGRDDTAIPAHGFIEYLSDARELFEREALDPRRGNDEVHSAIRGLRDREPDLSTIKAWLGGKDERAMVAGALLLDAVNHDGVRREDEIAILTEFARRRDSAPEAARIAVRHAADHDDPAFAPVLRGFEQHADPSVRELAARPSR
jgi:hypothetical protein